jgi:hypothetical protein
LALIKKHYHTSKQVATNGKWVFGPFLGDILDLQSYFSKLTMKNQASKAMEKSRDENPLTKLWHQLATNSLLAVCLFEFMRLVKLAIV